MKSSKTKCFLLKKAEKAEKAKKEKNQSKTLLLLSALLCVAVAFGACASPAAQAPLSVSTASSAPPATSTGEAAPAPQPAQEVEGMSATAFTPGAPLAVSESDALGSSNGKGYYEIYYRDDGNANVIYTDFATAQRTPLCSRPECTHDNESCTSFLNCSSNTPQLIATDTKLLYVYWGNADLESEYGAATLPRIESSDLNGANRSVLYSLPKEQQFTFSQADADSEFVYVCVEAYATGGKTPPVKSFSVMQINYNTGKAAPVLTGKTQSGNVVSFSGVCAGGIVMERTWVPDDAVLDANGREYRALIEYYLADPSGTITQIAAWVKGDCTGQKLGENIVYFENENRSLHFINLTTRENKVIAQDLPIRTDGYIEMRCVANNNVLMESAGEETPEAHVVDADTGKCDAVTLTGLRKAYQQSPILIKAYDENSLLAIIDQTESQDANDFTNIFGYKNTYALISYDDYCSSRPNYTMIETLP